MDGSHYDAIHNLIEAAKAKTRPLDRQPPASRKDRRMNAPFSLATTGNDLAGALSTIAGGIVRDQSRSLDAAEAAMPAVIRNTYRQERHEGARALIDCPDRIPSKVMSLTAHIHFEAFTLAEWLELAEEKIEAIEEAGRTGHWSYRYNSDRLVGLRQARLALRWMSVASLVIQGSVAA